MEQFTRNLLMEIGLANESVGDKERAIGVFLSSVSNENLRQYHKLISQLISGKNESDEDLEKAIQLYCLIVTFEKNDKEPITMDDGTGWMMSLVGFLTMEIWKRQGLVDEYSGFLYEGNVKLKGNKRFDEYSKQMINSLTLEQKIRYNLFGK